MNGELRFVRELASGGMGRVDLVVRREGAFARAYACKRLLAQHARDGVARALFLDEARIAGLVRHAHVVPVIDAGEDDEGPFLLMELVDGVSVAALVRRLGATIPIQVCVEIARHVAEGLHAAHELVSPEGVAMQLVHRDVSPANVLIGFDGIARVTDFGVARAVDRPGATAESTPVGKLSYMAPEQILGEPLDPRADLYALGLVLAEMLRGAPRGEGASPSEIARRTLEEPPDDPGEERPDLPPALSALLFELMARDREDRPRDARTVGARLAAICAELRAEEGPIDVGELVRRAFDDVRRGNARVLAEALRDVDATREGIALPELRAAGGLEGGAFAPDATTDVDAPSEAPAEDAAARDPGSVTPLVGARAASAGGRRARRAALAGVAVVVLLAIGVAARLARGGGDDAGASEGAVSASPPGGGGDGERDAPAEPPRREVVVDVEAAQEPVAVERGEEGAVDAVVTGEEPARRSARRRGRRRGTRTRTSGGSEIPTWSWDE